ncbi:restriction endonuclease [Xylella fastidiosa subsp. fastidiosa]|uniref:type II restriction-modification system restriction endonuclease n=1 Tax=Xylella fastidiosa TaxID=2371 RepID=UPI001E409C14|nr:restriction endonuclease [Xylella fastidiosa]UIT51758.1 restriction endonuclease [Xylella fastidiosa subsp. fastidiosa]WCF15551.1 restriction endonuclease [Xylella fastidiosa subsp. fastidiosa]WCF16820.1 restriction endonuclease [Xylella fastidiosa subsp. fastidiosa]WCF19006.1 restriction endonuclease [Xylella fastidiosa subsp. fastidiosa]WCF21226.1 restriction endonuclease [Xylella fastidiosa subsp. fastidiosa]
MTLKVSENRMQLDIESLCREAQEFSRIESSHPEPSLFGVTDGKAVGTYLEAKFCGYLHAKGYEFEAGNAANGLDFPSLNVDIKVTSIKQPQSSCPFRSIRQKIYGLGYCLLVFVYEKTDDPTTRTAILGMTDTVFVESEVTADFQMTKGLLEVLDADGNEDDLTSFIMARHLTTDEIELRQLAEEVMERRPVQGYLTISPALQWRLQYKRVIQKAGEVAGVRSIYKAGR